MDTDPIVRIYSSGELFRRWSIKEDVGLRDFEKVLVATYLTDKDMALCTVGCGEGRETFALYHLGYHRVSGVDCTPALLDRARAVASKQGLDIPFHLGNAEEIPYADGAFHAVTMLNNVYGLITPRAARLRALAELRRVLKPGGLFLLDATRMWGFYSIAIGLIDIGRCIYNPSRLERGDKRLKEERGWRRRWSPGVARSHWFRKREIAQDAAEVGFTVVQATTEKRILRNKEGICDRLRDQGRWVYVLGRA
jgi:SAM-dependent methyltransferase